jgi:hypothetical protein
MIHTIQNLKTLNLNPDFEFQQLLVSLKYVISLVYGLETWGVTTVLPLMIEGSHFWLTSLLACKKRSSFALLVEDLFLHAQ